jgi:hypothetical protein
LAESFTGMSEDLDKVVFGLGTQTNAPAAHGQAGPSASENTRSPIALR